MSDPREHRFVVVGMCKDEDSSSGLSMMAHGYDDHEEAITRGRWMADSDAYERGVRLFDQKTGAYEVLAPDPEFKDA